MVLKLLFLETSVTGFLNAQPPFSSFEPHQEYNRGSPNEGDGSGEFPFVASAVASGLPLSVLRQPQLLHPPLRHLQDNREAMSP